MKTEAPAQPQAGFSVIGKRNRKVEGRRKVTGSAVFADDLVFPRMLHAKILRSPHAHARIKGIDQGGLRRRRRRLRRRAGRVDGN